MIPQKGDTRIQSYLRIAAEGNRSDLPTETCCMPKTDGLIVDVAERIIGLDEEVQQLKNNPDVYDIVNTYADLQAYDTQNVTDKDIIRVLNDETHDGYSTYYRYSKSTDTWTYIGKVDAFVFEEFTFTLLNGTTVTKDFAVYNEGA